MRATTCTVLQVAGCWSESLLLAAGLAELAPWVSLLCWCWPPLGAGCALLQSSAAVVPAGSAGPASSQHDSAGRQSAQKQWQRPVSLLRCCQFVTDTAGANLHLGVGALATPPPCLGSLVQLAHAAKGVSSWQ